MTYIPNTQPLWAVISDPEVLPVCAWRISDDDDDILIPMVPNSRRGGLVPLAEDFIFIDERTPRAVAKALKALAEEDFTNEASALRRDGYTLTAPDSDDDDFTVTGGSDPAKREDAQIGLNWAFHDLVDVTRNGHDIAVELVGDPA